MNKAEAKRRMGEWAAEPSELLNDDDLPAVILVVGMVAPCAAGCGRHLTANRCHVLTYRIDLEAGVGALLNAESNEGWSMVASEDDSDDHPLQIVCPACAAAIEREKAATKGG
jgi:hypothetical protein